ncbi:hypothetical protein [Methanobrevibacter sp.]
MSNITPMIPNKYLTFGISNKLPNDNIERAKHAIGIGICLMSMLSKF